MKCLCYLDGAGDYIFKETGMKERRGFKKR